MSPVADLSHGGSCGATPPERRFVRCSISPETAAAVLSLFGHNARRQLGPCRHLRLPASGEHDHRLHPASVNTPMSRISMWVYLPNRRACHSSRYCGSLEDSPAIFRQTRNRASRTASIPSSCNTSRWATRPAKAACSTRLLRLEINVLRSLGKTHNSCILMRRSPSPLPCFRQCDTVSRRRSSAVARMLRSLLSRFPSIVAKALRWLAGVAAVLVGVLFVLLETARQFVISRVCLTDVLAKSPGVSGFDFEVSETDCWHSPAVSVFVVHARWKQTDPPLPVHSRCQPSAHHHLGRRAHCADLAIERWLHRLPQRQVGSLDDQIRHRRYQVSQRPRSTTRMLVRGS